MGNHICPRLASWAALRKDWVSKIPSFVFSCGHHSSLYLSSLTPPLQHWPLRHQMEPCRGLQGKGCNSHCAQLEHPVATEHHNLGRVGLSLSSASKKAESSFLDPGLIIYDTTMGSLLWTTATSPFFQPQGIPSTPSSRLYPSMQIQCLCTTSGSCLAFNLTLQQEKSTRQVSCS